MVDTFNHHGLPLSQTRCRHHCKQKELMRMKCRSCSRETYVKWAGSRERISSGLGGRAFFLTSLFIELIDRESIGAMAIMRWSAVGKPTRAMMVLAKKSQTEDHRHAEKVADSVNRNRPRQDHLSSCRTGHTFSDLSTQEVSPAHSCWLTQPICRQR